MPYIDATVMAAPTVRKDAWLAHAREVEPIIMETGAIGVVDAWGDDVPEGKVTDFRRAVQAKADETIVLGWIIWPDKATRDAGWEILMRDERLNALDPPFDGKRMIFGGFQVVGED